MVPFGVYVHLPWCRIRCPYCAFVVSARRDPPHAAYTRALLADWERQREAVEGPPATVYFGGGTPSRTPAAELARLLDALRPRAGAEVSAEVNPGDLDAPGLRALRAAGVDRVSLGVQSFSTTTARRLGRATAARLAPALLDDALAAGFRSVSVDLIFGVPGQSLDEWEVDLDRVVAAGVPHVSLYGLTIEPGTPFHRAGVPPADEPLWREMYDLAVARLGAAGIHRYEVSNFARPGHRSVHNEHYWRARPWVGLGAGAHGWWPDGRRTRGDADIDRWLGGEPPPPEVERPPDEALFAELVGSTLRHEAGVDRALVERWTGFPPVAPSPLVRGGLLEADDAAIRLGPEGFPLADGLAGAICTASLAARAPAARGADRSPRPRRTRARHAEAPAAAIPAHPGLGHTPRPGFPMPPDPSERPESLEIEVDPELIEAALRSVAGAPAEAGSANLPDTLDEIEVELPPSPPPPPDRPEARAVTVRLQKDQIQRLENDLRRLTEMRDEAEAQARELREAVRKHQAEFERFRDRSRRDQEEAARRAEEKVLTHLLETSDNLERAWYHVERGGEGAVSSGLRMSLEQVRATLRRAGLERIQVQAGDPFDPEVHEAVMHVPAHGIDAGRIAQELVAGYRLRGRLLRPVRVAIAAPGVS